MHIEIQHRWRYLERGKWRTTRHYASEEQIRKEHPEAVPEPGTQREQVVWDTPEEINRAVNQGTSRPYAKDWRP